MADDNIIAKLEKMQEDPFFREKELFGWIPQPCKPEYREVLKSAAPGTWKAEWFGDFQWVATPKGNLIPKWTWYEFKKGVHMTWQQAEMTMAEKWAYLGKAPKRIGIVAGHGIGKTAKEATTILGFMFVFPNSEVRATANTSTQLREVLWKEIYKWIQRSPYKAIWDWSTRAVRMRPSPNDWFAVAKTASKNNPEALAGAHAPFNLCVGEEASGIVRAVFQTMDGSLTGFKNLVWLISNPTRLSGYFYDAFHCDKSLWQNLQFNSEESPVVDFEYCAEMLDKYGRESEEYGIRVRGIFPSDEGVDRKGRKPLFLRSSFKYLQQWSEKHGATVRRMGIDPAEGGTDEAAWVLREDKQAKILRLIPRIVKISCDSEREVLETLEKTYFVKTKWTIIKQDKAGKYIREAFEIGADITQELQEEHGIKAEHCFMDIFGTGGQWFAEMRARGVEIIGVEVSKADWVSPSRFKNIRAGMWWRFKEAVEDGLSFLQDSAKSWEECFEMRYFRSGETKSKIQMIAKKDMEKSPNVGDAVSLTYVEGEGTEDTNESEDGLLECDGIVNYTNEEERDPRAAFMKNLKKGRNILADDHEDGEDFDQFY